ncbi:MULTISPECIES: FtsX-like permease family protein [Gordonibacter]|uniref:ABC transporter permease n=1 Tax=Gordonibacter urolithinfaciens TaxID=1335613 RepID=A0A423UM03_9ACTN|nr:MULTISPECIES: FtsX-like permease family protein [Gordonibacter]ROT90889.1 ABC transporter permease [Gordonibacter urolithinfaciens]
MRGAFNKDVLRSVTHSLGRFLAIAGIVALGTGFYAGLRMTAPDMKLAADQFYDGANLMDIRVVSTLGLTDGDLAALRGVEGVAQVMGAYETDVMATVNDEQYAIRVHSLPAAAAESDTGDGVNAVSGAADYLNRPVLVEGSWPVREGECVLSADKVMNTPTKIGDTVQITEGSQDVDDVLATRTYQVVGYVHSSYYVSSTSMGTTSLGSGSVQQFMYVPESDFSKDLPYTEAFVTVAGAAGEFSGSDAYFERVHEVEDRIEALAPAREQARVDGLRADAQKELDEKRADYERERADAEQQLNDAQRQLDEAAAAIAENEQKLADAQAAYDRSAGELASQRASAEAQLAEAERQLADGRAQTDAARPAIEQGQAQLADAWAQWQQGADALAAGWGEWQGRQDALSAKAAEWQQGMALWQAAWDANEDHPENPDYAENRARLEAQKQVLDAGKDEIDRGQAALDGARGELEAQQQAVNAARGELDTQQAAFDAQKAQFDAAVAQVEQGTADLASARSRADAQIAAAQQQLDEAAAQIASGRSQLEQGRADYEGALAEYERQKADADAQFADAERQIADAQQKIDDLENPSWLVMDRDQNYGVASFESDANRVDSIAQVFPFIFFLVAALVALTTMTRMVEEERVLIGTFKALGYSRARIASKYLLYAAVASVTGSVLGIAVLSQVLPAVISEAYAIIYFVPRGPLPIDLGLAGLAAGLGVGVTLVATWAAAFATLRERPATLMLPRAPKAGKRILLERIAPLWRRLSFSWKVTFRNLFRYKKRFVMTVIGIAGCTALLLTGLGLQDAINDIIDKQYGEIVHYNAVVTTEDDLPAASQQELDDLLGAGGAVESSTRVQSASMVASGPDKADVHASVVVPEDPGGLADFLTVRTRVGHEPLSIGDDGVVLAEKLANELGVGVGDTVRLAEQDEMGNATDKTFDLTVTGVMENYIYNYVFIGPGEYARMEGGQPAFSTYYAVTSSDAGERAQFNDAVRAIDGVKTVAYNDEVIDAYKSMLKSVGLIVIVLVVAAAALAFIVLYNLTNINITERQREIATLKVLGFTPREVSAYIYRETMLLSVIGCAVGLVLGVFMEGFVVVTAEVDQVMFGRTIHAASFVIAFLLTMLFTVLVMLAMRRKLARVDMVESLKSNE